MITKPKNFLAGETSPYLLQHADNPVMWYPWGEAALTKAKAEDKPVLLSIGYSACHWCHVMAHESFEDEATAALMNAHFINIKVDREERPDLDKIYQTAQHLLNGRTGGWPLTLFLMPEDHVPFFAGTYFPPRSRHGMPAFPDLLLQINDYYRHRRDEISTQNTAFMQALQQSSHSNTTAAHPLPDLSPVLDCVQQLRQSFDKQHGGFGAAPKFPHPGNIELLLLTQNLTVATQTQETAWDMAELTLQKMAAGGLYDHLGGGFCRYSVDEKWRIPHFEKMLYDNGPLLGLYAKAGHHAGNDSLFMTVAKETADWARREMQSAEGGYYSSLDADSEGAEGKFYVWDNKQVASVLDETDYALFSQRYGLDASANFEGKWWHLFVNQSAAEIIARQAIDQASLSNSLSQSRQTLLDIRSQRIWPARDEKILTSWNATMIKGMAIAARYCNAPDYLDSAESALTFIYENLWQQQRLLATYKDNKAHLNAYLDDYAFLIEAILELLSNRWHSQWLHFATDLADILLQQFYDEDHGGFFFTSHDHEKLLQRRKDFMDDALPSGNGVAVVALLKLAHLTGTQAYRQAAEATLICAAETLQRFPHGCTAMLSGLIELHTPASSIILRGDTKTMQSWQQQIYQSTDTRLHSYAIATTETDLPGLLAEKKMLDAKPTAYICHGLSCSPPLHDIKHILAALDNQSAAFYR